MTTATARAASGKRRLPAVAHQSVTTDMAVAAAEGAGVCVRPLLRQVTDRATGAITTVPIACGSTWEKVCPSCADKARRLRMHQCREGWHLTQDPPRHDDDQGSDPDDDLDEDADEQLDDEPDADENGPDQGARRVRSTRHLPGFPDLPTIPVEDRTIGQAFTDDETGRTYRPSMFLTLTLPSYGKVIPGTGVPVNPATYDYRRAALDALLFPRLVDRLWQKLRRCAGYQVQYFAVVEAQRRLAPHLHAAVRGAIPWATIKGVTRATYAAIWWPPIDEVVYQGDYLPGWHADGPHPGVVTVAAPIDVVRQVLLSPLEFPDRTPRVSQPDRAAARDARGHEPAHADCSLLVRLESINRGETGTSAAARRSAAPGSCAGRTTSPGIRSRSSFTSAAARRI
jgi:hypothetical protein